MKVKIVRITTVPISLKILLKGQLKYVNQFFEVIGVSSPGSDLTEVSLNEGIRVKSVKMTRKISPLSDLISIFVMVKFFLKEKPIIVHTHTPKAGLVGIIAAKIAKVPIRIHTVAGMPLMESYGFKRFLLINVEKIIYFFSTKVYSNSKGLFDYILKYKLTNITKLKLIGNGSSNGIDTNFFDPNIISSEMKNNVLKECGLNENDFIFIYVGRMVKDKGINELISAFNILKFPNSKLLLLGNFENELDPLSNSTLNSINSNQNIIHLGFKKDIRPYLSISNCLVFPSYREGFPNVVMQAGSMGLPCIVSDINGCNEIIINNVNGLIVKPKDINTLSLALLNLYNDKMLLSSLAKKSRPMIVSRYKQEFIWSAIVKEYETLLSQ